jgi:SAM-dependent methyltransferase
MRGYDLFARLYDLEHRDFVEDLELYLNFATRCGGAVLEVGCGTGRVTLALAEAGFDVAGIDDSSAMLALAQSHAGAAGLAERVELRHADVRTCELEPRFSLALFPLNGFLHLTHAADQLAALRNIHKALLPGGFLVVDLPNPHVAFSTQADGCLVLRKRFRSEEGHLVTSTLSTQTDFARQIQDLTLFYDEVGPDAVVQRTAVEMDLRFVYRYEMEALLREAGFKVDAVYGSHDLEPYEGDSEIMLFVAYT